ncbi:MAG TPA: hypothetical protein VEH58_07305 [Dehalococcoidales bacterium]|nr:hypothetical protein [Dehalococcoidales bacterium]
MDLMTMRNTVRRDLHDEDAENFRWTNDEIDRHIAHAVKDYSYASPIEQCAVLPTTAGSREIDISSLSERVDIEAVEYPIGNFPPSYQRFSLWDNKLTISGNRIPEGSDIKIFYGKLHTLSALISTIPVIHEDTIVLRACGYAAVELAIQTINRVNTGGMGTTSELESWGNQKLTEFRAALKRIDKKNRVRVKALYTSVEE